MGFEGRIEEAGDALSDMWYILMWYGERFICFFVHT